MKPELFSNAEYYRVDTSWIARRVDGMGSAGRLVRTSRLKRAFDVAVALAALLCLLPVMLVLAVLIKADSPGPVLFRQRRSGADGQVFEIFKFRSMRVLEDGDVIKQAVRRDDRVTRIGGILRRTSMDELPQLLNVLRGDMSIVGPRPHAVAHDQHFGILIPNYGCRFTARPGLTGLAQIRGQRGEIHTLTCMEARILSDVEYIETWSIFRDLEITLRTFPALLSRAAY